MESMFERNKAILVDTLAGMDREQCAQKHHVAVPTVGAALRKVLETLIEHTEIAIQPSVIVDYLMTHKATILKHLEEPIPKVNITPYAKTVLIAQFGKYYARLPKAVAAHWSDVNDKVNSYYQQRDRLSILQWLGSEGYLVDDYVSEEMTACFYQAVLEKTNTLDVTQGKLQCQVTKITHEYGHPTYTVQLRSGEHVVSRRFSLEILSY